MFIVETMNAKDTTDRMRGLVQLSASGNSVKFSAEVSDMSINQQQTSISQE